MYSQSNDRSQPDNRMSVSEMLSSMASAVIETTTTFANLDGLTSGIPTRTTPTLTPTTLKNIEESFLELQSIPPAPLEHQHQAGFVPPVVSIPTVNGSSYQSLSTKQEEPQWMSSCAHQASEASMTAVRPSIVTSSASSGVITTTTKSGRGSGSRRSLRDERLSPEEEERRRVRRERNKLAAARCRKRRMDHTNSLLQETEGLEEKRQALQNEIQMLSCQKEELEFILEAHKATCNKVHQSHSSTGKSVTVKKTVLSKGKPFVRPSSLPVSSAFTNPDGTSTLKLTNGTGMSEAAGVSISTPSGLFLDSLMGGGTGLTPSSGMIISSCSGQQRNSSSDLSSPDSISPSKLVTL